ncbi:hypothetical protein ACHAXR_009131 [Thalassiosira sp. AJA248-18]
MASANVNHGINMAYSRSNSISRRDLAMMATSALVLTLAVSPAGCAAFTPPATSSLLGSGSSSHLSSPHANAVTVLLPRPLCLGGNQICLTHSSVNTASSRGTTTSLSMGIRSFIKRKILRKDKGDDDGEDGDGTSDDDVTLHSILQSPGSAGLMESPLDGDRAEDVTTTDEAFNDLSDKKASKKASKKSERRTASKYVEDILGSNTDMEKAMYEDTQERIRRMKGGGMTEDEKMSFLNTALTRTLPTPKPRGPPIRQSIPGMDDAESSGGKQRGGGGKSSGKSAKENLLNAITRKSKSDSQNDKSSSPGDINVASLMMDGKMKDEEAKRKYMESITNPDRFSTFSTYQQPPSSSESEDTYDDEGEEDEDMDVGDEDEESEIEGVAASEEEELADSDDAPDQAADFSQMKRQIAEDRELLNPKVEPEKSAARDAVESILSMISSNNDKKKASSPEADTTTTDDDDGNTKKSTDHLAARLGQAAEEQEKRDKEARLAADRAAEEKREEERQKRMEAQMQREEELRRQEVKRIEKARKLADEERRKVEEREAAERAALEARQAAQDEYWANMLKKEQARKENMEPVEIKRQKEVIARDSEERVERDVAKDVQRERLREEEREREDPHEGEILKEAAEAKLRDRERVRAIEAQAAARVSRTVPKPTKEDASVSSFVREQQRKKEEIDRLRKLDEQSLKSLNSPLPSPGKGPVGIPPSPYLRPSPVVASPPPPAPVPAARSSSPDLSLASLTMAKKSEPPASPPPSPPPAPAQRLNLFEMTKLKKESDSSASSSPARPTPAKKKPVKRAVRQQLPLSTRSILGDDDEYDDDDDEDDLMRSGAPGLTVADALKQQRKKGGGGSSPGGKKNISADEKAKQWGIDMSKYT